MLRRTNDELQVQVAKLRELYDILRTRDDNDALQILRLMKNMDDPIQVLSVVSAGVALAGFSGPSQSQPSMPTRGYDFSQSRREQTSNASWTNVANAEVVAHLIDIFFSSDHAFPMAFIDKECFMADMQRQSRQGSKYCSQLLVNAICAVSCVRGINLEAMSSCTTYLRTVCSSINQKPCTGSYDAARPVPSGGQTFAGPGG